MVTVPHKMVGLERMLDYRGFTACAYNKLKEFRTHKTCTPPDPGLRLALITWIPNSVKVSPKDCFRFAVNTWSDDLLSANLNSVLELWVQMMKSPLTATWKGLSDSPVAKVPIALVSRFT